MGEGERKTWTDGDILARFEKNPAFKAAREGWNAGQMESFCAIARTVHDAGLDWWCVNIQPWQLRFGRKSVGRSRAEGVLGYLLGSPPHIDFNRGGIDLGLNDNMALTTADTQRFDVTFKQRAAETRAWLPPSPLRPGRWPDELEAEQADPRAGSKDEQSRIVTDINPTNLILYGPPGTGKTFSTAEEAVRLCDGALPDGSDDAAMRRRYGELVKARQVQFVTFHQSYAYEDFVEGLRPTTGEGEEATGGFRLEPVAGVFREIATLAEQARKAAAEGRHGDGFDLTGRQFWKMGLGAIGSEDHVYSAAVAGNYVALGWGADVDWRDPRFADLEEMRKEWTIRYPEDKTPSQTAQPWVRPGRRPVSDPQSAEFRSQDDYVSKYRRVLEYFDAVKIGLTATPALHTLQIFGEPIFTYSYHEAVIDGYLIDHEPPIRIETELTRAGITFQRDEQLEIFDTRTGKVDLVHAPDEIRFEVDSFNRRVITQEFNRVIAEELARHIDPSLPGKTLVFASTDGHADMLVNEIKKAMQARYGEIEDAAVRKVTGSVDRMSALIRSYRNDALPKIAVTVDLLTTGIDVPSITNLVFVRRVNSRILHEQMLGRATRLCDEIGKETFRIFDAVDLYPHLENLTDMKPVVVDPALSVEQLLQELTIVTDDGHRSAIRDQLAVKWSRKVRRLADEARRRYRGARGYPGAYPARRAGGLGEVVQG